VTALAEKVPISLIVNGAPCQGLVEAHHTLLQFLRNDLDLTGTKECCALGECGSCTVLVDGKAVNACLVLAAEVDRSEVTTIEGLATAGRLDPLQDAFLAHGAVQCGFCIPGMVMAARALLCANPSPSAAQVKEGLSGNLCRCGGYTRILNAVLSVASGHPEGRTE
jgi:aerobic-type carbon monoxide dehydrogenase small subunit (CoxS/CutS family)